MYKRSIKNLLLTSMLMAFGANAQTVSTPIVGFSKLTVPQGGRLIAPVFVKSPKFQGTATVTSGVFSVTGLTENTLNQTSYADRPNYPTHYVKVTSDGVYKGLVLDIISNTSSTITVGQAPAGLVGTVSIVVVPHYTLKDLADQSSNLTPYYDLVTVYSSGNNKSSYYFTGDTNGFISDDYSTPANNVVIYPGSGVILNSASAATITMTGTVNTTQTVVPIYAGESIVTPLDPSGVSKVAGINLAAALSPYYDLASQVLLDGSLSTTTFYSDGTNMLNDGYEVIPLASSPTVASGNGFIVNALSDTQWIQPPVINP